MASITTQPAADLQGHSLPNAPRHPGRQRWTTLLILFALSGFLFFYGLNAGEFYRNESLRAIVAAEMLRTGNWIVPTLYGQPLLTKPPGMYVAIALASWPAGAVKEWTARLPSALAATAMAFLFYWYFARQIGRRGGLVAAVALATSYAWLDKAPSAEIDMLQVAWVTAAILFFLRAVEGDSGTLSTWLWWLAALLCVAGGFLTKWTAPAFFYLTAVPLLWWRGQLRLLWGRYHLASTTLAAGLCLAWMASAVAAVGGDTFYTTVSREALTRLAPHHHAKPYAWLETLAHPFQVLAVALPWSPIALLTLRPGFAQVWDERGRRLLQALHCWTWPNLLFWSIIPGHAVRHSLPLCPGLAGLAALVWVSWLRGAFSTTSASGGREPPVGVEETGGSRPPLAGKAGKAARVLVGMVALWLVVKVVFIHAVVPMRQDRDLRAKGERLAAAVPAGEMLYLFRLKDEGVLFYYGREARRLPHPGELPSSAQPLYCILVTAEWEHWQLHRPAREVLRLHDGQGDPIVLVRVSGQEEAGP